MAAITRRRFLGRSGKYALGGLATTAALERLQPDLLAQQASSSAKPPNWLSLTEEPALEPNLSASLREVGQDPGRVVEQARSERIGQAYQAATDEARGLGIFGSPTFAVHGELFWGDDSLDDALCWLRHGRLTS